MQDTQRRHVTQTALPRIAYGVHEIADALGLSPGFIRLEIQRGKLTSFRAGRRVLISAASFNAYVAGQAE